MQGIIFNTQTEFDTLETALQAYVQSNVSDCSATKWANPIVGLDGKILMIGVDDIRVSNFDFTGYSIVTLDQTQIDNFFPQPV